jgi:hypothetical protein
MSRRTLPLLAAAALGLAAAPASAQSLLASRGLGYTLEALDARARGLGGVTVGLAGAQMSMVNPAAVVGLPAPGVSVTVQPDVYDATAPGGVATSGTTVRFPMIQVAFPVTGRFTGSVGYGSFMDQHWQVEQADSIDLPTGSLPVRDRFVSDGGIARFRLGAGARVTDALAVGLAFDLVTGATADSTFRTVGDGGLFPAVRGSTFRYSGVGVSGGVRWSPGSALTLAAALAGGGRITAETEDSTGVEAEKSYAQPLRLDAGASARISQNTVVALSGTWTGWSALEDDLDPAAGGAQDALSVSGGIEWEGLQMGRRAFPLRLGARFAQLPFRWGAETDGNDFPAERALSAGAGARLARRRRGRARRVVLALLPLAHASGPVNGRRPFCEAQPPKCLTQRKQR